MTTNLSGSLAAFGLDEVLALLGMGGRTAQLEVRSAAGVGSVHLVDGEVSSASADLARAGLLRQVVAAASVPASDLARALEEGEPVRALVDSGASPRAPRCPRFSKGRPGGNGGAAVTARSGPRRAGPPAGRPSRSSG